ncbi:tRNA (adenosine(37)-N6)-dimethylallyltransferase MiaA [Paenibacillus sp. ACRRX]|uniref:tRNA (adenosine(37)-N6)-dimethylallyltransferase MiaA n=1 Tax=Paenibacillus sp. ACRRX TaxID=2918206 RepID=UPI001EF5CCA8|nr:tRNA (adenosine(37)-N6)-dimethylallyltransferase MiaA [Paenibacillus sp. ACRRX]MCG7406723.1 tRNA (adenosine(37)-N6)-dimethylallyltransferase MiaA [Paenibacillus sp. ACRRX]
MSATNSPRHRLLVLVGPTAVGKTKLSLQLAHHWNAEIISGDSMQVYRHMDIGTAKLPFAERDGIPHYMMDIHEPDEPFSVAEFQDRCRELIPDIASRHKLPFIVGGTGLYVESLCYGFEFSEQGSDEPFRLEMAHLAEDQGNEVLHEQLRLVDPESAERLHPNDVRRVIRALEIFRLTGQKMSEQLEVQQRQPQYDLCFIGLTMDRQLLYKRIEARIDEMLEEGLVQEVEQLLQRGYSRSLVSMQGLGYKEIAAYLAGETSYEAAVTLLKRDTRRFAKRQLSWFRRMKDIHWVDVTDSTRYDEHFSQICGIVAGKFR